MMRIGLTQRVEVVSERQERYDCLDQRWIKLLRECGLEPIPLPNTTPDPEAFLKDWRLSGFILTGGNDLATLAHATNPAPERDELENRLIKIATQQKIPILGVCRGMQILLDRDGIALQLLEGHVRTTHQLTFEKNAPWSEPKTVNSYHRFGFSKSAIKAPWQCLAFSPDGTAEAIQHLLLPFWGMMWHPEREPLDRQTYHFIRSLFTGEVQ